MTPLSRAEQIGPDRASSHGSFGENARLTLDIRTTMRSAVNWSKLRQPQQLALEEIALKIARILSSDDSTHAGQKEHWDDIEGYAKLGGKYCVD